MIIVKKNNTRISNHSQENEEAALGDVDGGKAPCHCRKII